MAITKPRIAIIGAGMAGIAAATRLCKSSAAKHFFDISIVEGGSRIGGRINTSQFNGNPIELGATWIHGIEGSPIYKIAQESNLLHSPHPWEAMDGFPEDVITAAEGGHILKPSIVEPISDLFRTLNDFAHGDSVDGIGSEIENQLTRNCGLENLSVGTFLRKAFESYRGDLKNREGILGIGKWRMDKLEEAIFAMNENLQRSISAVDDLGILDYKAEKEYKVFPGDHIAIAKGYSSAIESMAAALPVGTIRLNQKVEKIEWCRNSENEPLKLHVTDKSTISADHAIITVSLGVLKNSIDEKNGLFDPPLPSFKADAISRLGYGVADKVFLQVSHDDQPLDSSKFPFLQTVFHEPDSEFRSPEIPNWIRRMYWLHPIYKNSDILLSWFSGRDALEIENLSDEEILSGFSTTVSNLLRPPSESCDGSDKWEEIGISKEKTIKFAEVKRSRWGTDPLFLGSYSYVPVGSSGDDFDALAEPLPDSQQFRILFAGEATHRTYYSTTHGAYLSGIREADRLLPHYGLL